MRPRRRLWPVRLSAAAEGDYRTILAWTVEHFGRTQMRTYQETLISALESLSAGSTVPGAKPVVELPQGFFTLHVQRRGRKGRHVIVFRVRHDSDGEGIEVVRILHDAMDITRYIPSS